MQVDFLLKPILALHFFDFSQRRQELHASRATDESHRAATECPVKGER